MIPSGRAHRGSPANAEASALREYAPAVSTLVTHSTLVVAAAGWVAFAGWNRWTGGRAGPPGGEQGGSEWGCEGLDPRPPVRGARRCTAGACPLRTRFLRLARS